MNYYGCSVCDYKTDNRANYMKHVSRTKHKKKMDGLSTRKTYECKEKGCLYKTKICGNFKTHQKTHLSNINNFRCIVCDILLTDRHHIHRHLKQTDHISNVISKEMDVNKTSKYIEKINNLNLV